MKKIVCLIFAILMLASFCACSGTDEETTTIATTENQYELSLYGEWKRENSNITVVLTSGNYGTQKQGGLTTNLYWEADAKTILIKTNQVGDGEPLQYLLEPTTLTIYNANGTKTVYKRVK